MASDASFVYSIPVESVIDRLPLDGLDTTAAKAVQAAVGMLADRDFQLEDFLTTGLTGQRGLTVITATAGGATITFGSPFSRTPVIVVGNPNDSGGHTACVVDASIGTSSFKVQVFNGATEVTVGTYKVPWIAT